MVFDIHACLRWAFCNTRLSEVSWCKHLSLRLVGLISLLLLLLTYF